MRFIDEISITVASGHGGPGSVHFRRESMTPRGGPDGGDGGRGGDLILKVAHNLNSLLDYRRGKLYAAQDGTRGGGDNCSGPAGQDLILYVPPGTIVRNKDGEILVDMTGIKEYVMFKGGRGGKGNYFFRTSVNQAPEHAQPGEDGVTMDVTFELKLIADVGIIGFPNAGKSTLISRISAARPKIADYPFTTLVPNLGVVKIGDYRSFVIADIPGLIRGAHEGLGLGIQFLKHIERTRLFLHMIDASEMTGVDPVKAYEEIQYELEMYDKSNSDKEGFFPLGTRQQLIVLNKIDTLPKADLERLIKRFEKQTNQKPWAISAVTGKNVEQLLLEIEKLVIPQEESEL